MRYDLTRLGPHEFEHLVQSLALATFGGALGIFGDGPDGGREATFDGEVPFPSPESPWNGYGVVQAKYKSRLTHPHQDVRWVQHELKREFDAWLSPRSARKPSPSYYVFATNVILSPGLGGGNDDVQRTMKIYADRLGLDAFVVWDNDQLCRMLDIHDGIRRTYAAWITPGDVLAELLADGSGGSRLESSLHSYLAMELISDQYARLGQAGYDAQTTNNIPLARVFIDLPIVPAVNEPLHRYGFVRQAVDLGNRHHRARGSKIQDRIVLIGGPGQGKTTAAQFLCQLYRAALLGPRRAQLASEALSALDAVDRQLGELNLSLPDARRWPVRVELTGFAEALAKGEPYGLLGFIAKTISARSSTPVRPWHLKEWLGRIPWILVVDGLDEVPASANRRELLSALADFWVEAAEVDADLFVIATTRPQGYNSDFSPDHFTHTRLSELPVAHALAYGKRLVAERYSHDVDHVAQLSRRLDDAARDVGTMRLMTTPLQTTIMAALVDGAGTPPRDRYTLFREYYRVIYQRERGKEGPVGEILRERPRDVDAIHERAGLLLQIRTDIAGEAGSSLSEEEFLALIMARLAEQEHDEATAINVASALRDAATNRLVLLTGQREDAIGFEVRSIQEFMAARALTEGGDDHVRRRLHAVSISADWRNVLLFAVGRIYDEREYLGEFISALCGQLNAGGISDEDDTRATLAGSRLALEILADGSPRGRARHVRALAHEAARLLDLPPNPSQRRLAAIVDDDALPILIEEIAHALRSDSPRLRSAAWVAADAFESTKVKVFTELIADAEPRGYVVEDLVTANAAAPTLSLIRRLDRQVHRVPNDTLLDAVSRMTSGSPRSREDQRLNSLADIVGARHFTIAFKGTPGLEMRLRAISSGDVTPWRRLTGEKVVGSGNAFSVVSMGARFAIASNEEVLAEILHTFAGDLDYARRYQWILPWPVAACVAAAEDGAHLLRLAAAAAAGTLGTPYDWAAAEARWRSGVRLDELFIVDELPVRPAFARSGVPIFGSEAVVGFDAVTQTEAKTVLGVVIHEWWPAIPPGRQKSFVARLILAWLSAPVWKTPIGPAMTGDLVALAAQAVKVGPVPLGWVQKLLLIDEAVGSSLDELGRLPLLSTAFEAEDASRALAELWRRSPEAWGLGALSVALASRDKGIDVTELPRSTPEIDFVAAAVALVSRGGAARMRESIAILRDLPADNALSLSSLASKVPGSSPAAVAVYRELRDSDTVRATRLIDRIVAVQSARAPRLVEDPQLGLPRLV